MTAGKPEPMDPARLEELRNRALPPPARAPRRERPLARALKHLRVPMLAAVDRGWFGLTPLDRHVVVCGFPRSGSTLLLLIAETCVSDAAVFGTEVWAIEAARFAPRNASVMITKRPNDVLEIDRIRAHYATRRARPHFVITVRDPRAILTSVHAANPALGYYVSPERWRALDTAIEYYRGSPDVSCVELSALLQRPAEIEERLRQAIGWQVHTPFERFHEMQTDDFRDREALGGVRPLDASVLDRWRDDEHRARVRLLLDELPELPARLVELGYERDDRWVAAYR